MAQYRVTFKDSTVREAIADGAAGLVWLLGGPSGVKTTVEKIEIQRFTDHVYVETGIVSTIDEPPGMWLDEIDTSDCEEVDSNE